MTDVPVGPSRSAGDHVVGEEVLLALDDQRGSSNPGLNHEELAPAGSLGRLMAIHHHPRTKLYGG